MSELVRYGEQVNSGEIIDQAFHATIYRADDNDDPLDEAIWFKCNEMRVAAEQAKRLPARETTFL